MLDEKKKIVKNVPIVEEMSKPHRGDCDPFGSYTGAPIDESEVPVQDADDL